MTYVNPTEELFERIHWFIKLRWIAVAGVVFAGFFVDRILNIPLPVLYIYAIAAFLGIYNLSFLIYLGNIAGKKITNFFAVANRIANLQTSLDLLCLAALIHFSGGVENPFLFYFIFHVIMASILLTRRASFLQATFAVFLFSSTVFLEYKGILAHYCLEKFMPYSLHENLIYISGVSFVFVSTLYIAVYMATAVSDRLREREKSLQKANELLNKKDRIKSEYVLRVTHDIKEHLSAIQSCIAPVTEGITGSLNEKQKDMLQRARARAGKLIFFVKALLEITTIKLTKRLKKENFSFAESIKVISEDIRMRSKSKGVTFKVDVEPSIDRIIGVRVYIEEAISNLLANSVKYTPRGGRITLKASDRKRYIRIEIRDTGIGIPSDELSHVFEEFYRGRNAKQIEKTGTGLGLSIAKEIVELHQGNIWVESEEGKGTVFYLEFPKK